MSHYSNTDLVIYHGKCPDGVASAWCFWKLFGNSASVSYKPDLKFHPGKFEENPPDVSDKNVVFVDFTYPLKVMLDLSSKAKTITVLDHHKSAVPLLDHQTLRFNVKLDMNRSGAQIAWDELYCENISSENKDNAFKSNDRPWFINDIADRDLWTWQLEGSKDTTRSMFSLGHYESFEAFNKIQEKPREYYSAIGESLNKDDDRLYTALQNQAIDCLLISPKNPEQTWKVRLASCYHSHASELGNRLVSDGLCDFAVLYRYDILRDEWWLSCRASNKSDIDLVGILKQFDKNSGGHAKAAGMTLKQPLLTYFKPVDKKFTDSEKTKQN
jgi:oligoribonuclease NrnB/cAMP/cGMP phosphodiesterase (DHH superfamily)